MEGSGALKGEGGFQNVEWAAQKIEAKGAEFEMVAPNIGALRVNPDGREDWNSTENLQHLSRYFWPVIGQGKPDDFPERMEWLRGTYGSADSVYVMFGIGGPIGTACLREHDNDKRILVIHDVTLNRGTRRGGLGQKLFQCVLRDSPPETKGFIGIASNPYAINAYAAVADSMGMVLSWGNIRAGEEDLYRKGYEYAHGAGYDMPNVPQTHDGLVFVEQDDVLPKMLPQAAGSAAKLPRMRQYATTISRMLEAQRRLDGLGVGAKTAVGAVFVLYPKQKKEIPDAQV